MAAVAITRFELDDDPDEATFDMKIGGSVFRQWRMRRYGGADGVRHFVEMPRRGAGFELVASPWWRSRKPVKGRTQREGQLRWARRRAR